MPTKWLQERGNGSKNEDGIGFEGPGVGPPTLTPSRVSPARSVHALSHEGRPKMTRVGDASRMSWKTFINFGSERGTGLPD